jgi:hypothetical protein
MKKQIISILRKALIDQRGQVIPWTGFMILTILGMSGLVVDVGRAYIAHTQLQNTVNAAALAAAGSVYINSTTNGASAIAANYSAGTGDENANVGLGSLSSPTVSTVCLNLLEPSGTTCGTSSAANAVKVTQSTTIKTFFMPIIFGPKTLTVGATAMASMQGTSQPWNVAIIIDATDSMVTNNDSNCGTTTVTRFQCALNGVSSLLQYVTPCGNATGSSCTTSTANFRVSLWAFPNVYRSQVADDYGCAGTKPTPIPYNFPNTQATSYTQTLYGSANDYATYEVTGPKTSTAKGTTTSLPTDADANGFLSDYSSTSGNSLNSSSVLVKAIGGASSGCADAMNTAGGEGTYYAGVIYAAQAALDAEWKLYGGKNAIILLSDGEATASSSQMEASGSTVTPSAGGVTTWGSNGNYPGSTDECQQAIAAAQSAAQSWTSGGTTYPGSRVYAVAYGAENTGCSTSAGGTDSGSTYISSIKSSMINESFAGGAALTPCVTMQNIANSEPGNSLVSLNYFYSDSNQSGSANGQCAADAIHNSLSNLNDIFGAIATDFTTPRLLPNNAT